jgi:uncharacterized protein (TIGR00730 family)
MNSNTPPRTVGFWFLARTLLDLIRGLHLSRRVGPCVTVFGSARVAPGSEFYRTALALGSALGRAGCTVMTGGGSGAMEAVSRGVKAAGGRSVGCRMHFPWDEHNGYLDQCVTFRYFFIRKVTLCRTASAFVALPGGFGTLDELFEVLTLIQTRRIARVPIVLVGRAYWRPLCHVLERMAGQAMVNRTDLELVHLVDDVESVVDHVKGRVPPLVEADSVAPPWRQPSLAPAGAGADAPTAP